MLASVGRLLNRRRVARVGVGLRRPDAYFRKQMHAYRREFRGERGRALINSIGSETEEVPAENRPHLGRPPGPPDRAAPGSRGRSPRPTVFFINKCMRLAENFEAEAITQKSSPSGLK